MAKQSPFEQINAQQLIINSKNIEIDELEHKVRYQNLLIANLKAEISILKKDIKSFLGDAK